MFYLSLTTTVAINIVIKLLIDYNPPERHQVYWWTERWVVREPSSGSRTCLPTSHQVKSMSMMSLIHLFPLSGRQRQRMMWLAPPTVFTCTRHQPTKRMKIKAKNISCHCKSGRWHTNEDARISGHWATNGTLHTPPLLHFEQGKTADRFELCLPLSCNGVSYQLLAS